MLRVLFPSLILATSLFACFKGQNRDKDGDGYTPADGDCDDDKPNLNPGATDIAGDDVDQNCDGVDGTDFDGDGVASTASGGDDCDDRDSGTFPGSPEVANDGIDQDCDELELRDEALDAVASVPLDLLFVIDDSCSMAEEQARFSDNAANFIVALNTRGLDYRVGVITTDMTAHERRGKLIAGPTGRLWVDGSTPSAASDLAASWNVGTNGSPDEKGLAASYSAIVAHGGTHNAGFRRQDAHLAIAVISDENDYSSEDIVDGYVPWLTSLGPGRASFHFNGYNTSSACGFSSSDVGTRYLNVLAAIGGVFADLCADNTLPFLTQLLDHAAQAGNAFTLTPAPVPNTLQVFLTAGGEERELEVGEYRYNSATQSLTILTRLEEGDTLRATFLTAEF